MAHRFGGERGVHSMDILRLCFDLPIVVEVVETEEKLQSVRVCSYTDLPTCRRPSGVIGSPAQQPGRRR